MCQKCTSARSARTFISPSPYGGEHLHILVLREQGAEASHKMGFIAKLQTRARSITAVLAMVDIVILVSMFFAVFEWYVVVLPSAVLFIRSLAIALVVPASVSVFCIETVVAMGQLSLKGGEYEFRQFTVPLFFFLLLLLLLPGLLPLQERLRPLLLRFCSIFLRRFRA